MRNFLSLSDSSNYSHSKVIDFKKIIRYADPKGEKHRYGLYIIAKINK